ncbi:Uncharacterised protein [Mycobacteroides abscessus subsp. abscessus]|nr:Uncharacterised protein [Mycobacteroides abscessus subsp. abscessus]
MSLDSRPSVRSSFFAALVSCSSVRSLAFSSYFFEASTRASDWLWFLSVAAPSSFQNFPVNREAVFDLRTCTRYVRGQEAPDEHCQVNSTITESETARNPSLRYIELEVGLSRSVVRTTSSAPAR